MGRQFLYSLKYPAVISVVILTAVFILSPRTDPSVSEYFYHKGGFYLRNGFIAWLITHGIPYGLGLVGLMIFGLWLWGRRQGCPLLGVTTPVMLLTFGTMCLGPGLITNGIFKSFWGRARPEDVTYFGGDKLFSLPLEISNQCNWDCSFMSGHTAIAFWSVSLALLFPRRLRVYTIGAAIMLGTLVGAARIAQGRHFLSDVIFAAVITLFVVAAFYKGLFPEQKDEKILDF